MDTTLRILDSALITNGKGEASSGARTLLLVVSFAGGMLVGHCAHAMQLLGL